MSGAARAFDVACLGRAAVDLYGEQIGAPLEDVSTFARYLGGSPANTAVGASRLGLRAAMISRVGDEQNGRFVRATLAREGVDVSQVSTDGTRLTALVFLAIRDRDDFPHIFYRDNCADMALSADDIDPAFIGRCGALLLSGTHLSSEGPCAASHRALAAARESGVRVVLDIDYRPVLWGQAGHGQGAERHGHSEAAARKIAEVLPGCDLVVGTEEEFCVAGGNADVLAALRAVRSRTRALLVVKRGALGCVAFDGPIPTVIEGGLVVPGFPIEVFNVLGAGDAFMAGLLRGWLRGAPVADACQLANACGALVVSRHGCAPAMASWSEVQHFLAKGSATPRVREDAELSHLHRATTRRPLQHPLFILAFDHRSQLEAIAREHAADASRIPRFKALVARAFQRVSGGRPNTGVLLDDLYGRDILPSLTGRGHWIARPVEVPGSVPVAFEAGAHVGMQMRGWPSEHIAKVLACFNPDDSAAVREAQIARLRELAAECAAGSRESLFEIIPHRAPGDATAVAQAMDLIYSAGVKPDWWKLPPSIDGEAWRLVDEAIERFDPWCRGVLVLGMEASPDRLGESFAAAARSPWVRGFAVGRSIFGTAASEWFAGRWDDERAVDDVAARYQQVITIWEAAAAAPARHILEEEA